MLSATLRNHYNADGEIWKLYFHCFIAAPNYIATAQVEMFSIKQIGWPVMVNCPLPDERNQIGYEFAKQSCGFAVYKDPNMIPEYVYEKLGFQKPNHIEKPKQWK